MSSVFLNWTSTVHAKFPKIRPFHCHHECTVWDDKVLKSESTPSPLLYSCINRNTYYHNRYSGATAVHSQFILQYPKWLCNYFTLWSLGLRITICMCYNNYFSWIPNSTIDKNSSFIIDKMICIFEVCANQVHLLSIQ